MLPTFLHFLQEKFYSYQLPDPDSGEGKEKMLYDFYILTYVQSLIDKFPSKTHRGITQEQEDSVGEALRILVPYLCEEMSNAVFYSVCCEFRHVGFDLDSQSVGELKRYLQNKNPKQYRLFVEIVRGLSDLDLDEDDYDGGGPETGLGALAKTKSSKATFMELAADLFSKEEYWDVGYGGKPWAQITEGWMRLQRAKTQEDQIVAIDHIYDLQHNSGSVFDKLAGYYQTDIDYRRYTNTVDEVSNMEWLYDALEKKANVRSIQELLNDGSGTVKLMSLPIIKDRLGATWDQHLTNTRTGRIVPFNIKKHFYFIKDYIKDVVKQVVNPPEIQEKSFHISKNKAIIHLESSGGQNWVFTWKKDPSTQDVWELQAKIGDFFYPDRLQLTQELLSQIHGTKDMNLGSMKLSLFLRKFLNDYQKHVRMVHGLS